MASVFEYSDYRAFLRDTYAERKAAKAGFSYTVLARRAGFANKGFLHNVLHGGRNLSKQSAVNLARALGLSQVETDYFENLVFFNQATDARERTHYYEALTSVRTRSWRAARVQQVRREQYEFYSTWYHSAVRSLIDMYPFKDDYRELAARVYPPISLRQAKRSVGLLLKLGMVERDSDGYCRLSGKHITTGAELLDVAARQYHRDCAAQAVLALDALPKEERNVTGMTLGVSRKAYERICGEAAEFRKRVVEIVNDDTGSDRVYQLTIHLFPMSRPDPVDE